MQRWPLRLSQQQLEAIAAILDESPPSPPPLAHAAAFFPGPATAASSFPLLRGCSDSDDDLHGLHSLQGAGSWPQPASAAAGCWRCGVEDGLLFRLLTPPPGWGWSEAVFLSCVVSSPALEQLLRRLLQHHLELSAGSPSCSLQASCAALSACLGLLSAELSSALSGLQDEQSWGQSQSRSPSLSSELQPLLHCRLFATALLQQHCDALQRLVPSSSSCSVFPSAAPPPAPSYSLVRQPSSSRETRELEVSASAQWLRPLQTEGEEEVRAAAAVDLSSVPVFSSSPPEANEMPMACCSATALPGLSSPVSSSSSSSPTTAASEPLQSLQRPRSKRRRSEELEERERWYCGNDGCSQFYRTTSSNSIARHQARCSHRTPVPATVTLAAAADAQAATRRPWPQSASSL